MVVSLADIDAEIARRGQAAQPQGLTIADIDAEIARRQQPQVAPQPEVQVAPQPEVEQTPFLEKAKKTLETVGQLGIPEGGTGLIPSSIEVAQNIPVGLGQAFVGGVQTGADILGALGIEGAKEFSRRLGEVTAQELKQERTVPEKVGQAIGQAIPFVGLGTGLGLVKGSAVASGAAAAAQPLEDSGIRERVKEGVVGAGLGAAGGAAFKGLSKVASKVRNVLSRGESPRAITSLVLKKEAGNLFKEAAKKGGDLEPSFVDDLAKKAQELRPQSKAGKLLEENRALLKISKDLDELKGERLDLDSIKDIDEFLGGKINDLTENGVVKADGNQLLNLQLELRKKIETINPKEVGGGKKGFIALKKARRLWSKSVRLGDIERIIERAEFSDNPATAIKSGFRALATNPKRLRGYSAKEKELIKEAAKTGILTDIFRTFGSRLIPIGTGIAGGAPAGTAAATLGSIASRGAASKSQAIRAQKVVREIIDSSFPGLSNARKVNLESKLIKGLKQIPGVFAANLTKEGK